MKPMNKKGLKLFGLGFEAGDSSSGLYAIVIVIYFIFFIVVGNAVADLDSSFNFSDSSGLYNTVEDSVSTSFQYCDSPRYKFEYGSATPIEMPYYDEPTLRCDITRGLLDSTECNAIEGCDWVNVTTNSWTCWLPLIDCTTIQSCEGYMNIENISDYPNISVNPLGTAVAGYDYDDFAGMDADLLDYLDLNGFEGNSICKHPGNLENKTSCEYFECSWIIKHTNTTVGIDTSSRSLFAMVTDTFKFGYVFDTGNGTIDTFLYLIFILIPFILLILFTFYAIFGGSS